MDFEKLKQISNNKRWSDSFFINLKNLDCLEIGGGDGITTRYLSRFCKRVFVIDPWEPKNPDAINQHYHNFVEMTKDLPNVNHCRTWSDTDDARKYLMTQSDLKVGAVYIDGETSAEAVVNDWVLCDRWLLNGGYVFINNCSDKKVEFGCGWILQHFNHYYTELPPSSSSLSVWDDSQAHMRVFRKN